MREKMMPHPTAFRNQILSQLPADELAIVAPRLEHVELPRGFLIAGPDQDIKHIYFLEQGIGSVVSVSPGGAEGRSRYVRMRRVCSDAANRRIDEELP